MSREVHVQFLESLGVRIPQATQLQRILLLYEDGNQPSKICFYTGLGRKLVSEYIDFIKEHNITHSGAEMLDIKLSKP